MNKPREAIGATERSRPIRLALIDDYDVIVRGVARKLDDYHDRIEIAEVHTQPEGLDGLERPVDIAFYDSFAQPEADHGLIDQLINSRLAQRVVVFTWSFHDDLVRAALGKGVSGYLSKALPARDLVSCLERVAAGDVVVSDRPSRSRLSVGLDWPGRSEGLTEREAEILALITQGKTNAEIARFAKLSINSVKTHIRALYRKIEVANRVEAVLWGVERGFRPSDRAVEGVLALANGSTSVD